MTHHETALEWYQRRRQPRPSLGLWNIPNDTRIVVLEGSRIVQIWTLKSLAAQWVTTIPQSEVIVLDGEDVQVGLSTVVQAKVSSTSSSATTWQDCMKRIHFGRGTVAILEVLRYCEAPLLLLWDNLENDPDLTRQLDCLIQTCPQISVVVAGKWSGTSSKKVKLEQLSGGNCQATVSGQRFEFQLTLSGILG